MAKLLGLIAITCLYFAIIANAQTRTRGFAQEDDRRTSAGHIGIQKACDARVAAMEELIREYEEKFVAVKDKELELEARRLAMDKRQADEDVRIRERERQLEQREAEINAYHNDVLKQQDERERKIEVLTRGIH